MTYKGYEAVVKFDEDAHLFHGDVINTRDVITFQGSSVDELEQAFKDSVDDYLELCVAWGRTREALFRQRDAPAETGTSQENRSPSAARG